VADPTRNIQPLSRVDPELRSEAELSRRSAEATAGAGLVRVQVDGHGTLRSLVIAPEAFAGHDADLLADLIMSAVTEAQRRLDDNG
jgi:hypothetical protein